MNEQRATQVLKETFTNHFDSDNFILFIKELFNKFDYVRKDAQQEDIPKDFQEFIDSYSSFGRYEDSEKKFVEVLSVKLKKNNPESARTMQRNFIAKYLTQHNADAALVAFYGDEVDNWRFSFVKLEYHLERDEKGNVKPTASLTPPKRYSFLVGKTEPSHTAQSQFLELLMQNQSLTVLEIESSFSVEKVTKEFFEKYKELFLELEEYLNKIVKQNEGLAKEFTEKGISTSDFTKKLLGQIVFIYFLQKKGWLGIEKDGAGKFNEWGTGHKDFLKRLYNKDIVSYNNFFNDILEPLFYEALARDRENDYYSPFRCKIPFLNGGLFEPLGGYNWTDIDILIDNKIFGKILETFDLYNFTVKEDEPLEKEVAIDPEMLGKVFENLLEVKDRKSKGSYYTPREIVYYMCQESLINYLKTRTGIGEKQIDDFIYNGEMSSQIRDNKEKIDRLLKDIKVVDPAIGSGAFPVGMMMEIIKARATLTKLFPIKEQPERTTYNFKRECIEDSLYGVDIDSGAVDIAQLRLWLSLIVDETDIHKIKPLPNLDYKIMCGNSLLDEFEGVKLFDEHLLGEGKKKEENTREIENIEESIEKLYQELGEIWMGKKADNRKVVELKKQIKKLKRKKQELLASPKTEGSNRSLSEVKKIKESQNKLREIKALHKQFFNEHDRRNKKALREEIEKRDLEFIEETLKEQGNEEAIKKLEQIKKTRSKPFFLWKLYFSDVFQENGGFDVIIGNPPYIMVTSLDNKDKRFFAGHYKTAFEQYNIYYLFYEKAISLIENRGIIGFIAPIGFLNNKSGLELRKLLLGTSKIIQIVDVSHLRVFKDASTYPGIAILQKETDEKVRSANTIGVSRFVDLNNAIQSIMKIKQKDITKEDYSILIDSSPEISKILNKVEANSVKLNTITLNYRGMQLNKIELLDEKRQEPPAKNEFVFNAIHLRDVKKWLSKKPSKIILHSDKQAGIKKRILFSNDKILIPRFVLDFQATYSDKNEYILDNIYIIQVNKDSILLKYLLAVLNSKLMNFYYRYRYSQTHISGGYFAINGKQLENLPIRLTDRGKQQDIINIVNEILEIKGRLNLLEERNTDEKKRLETKVYQCETQINDQIFKIYGLSEAEIGIIKGM